ncbi:MAG: rRNA maturation RNase YbeY [Candidatus Eremiobacteraeota bacterium]|nr:rRNA maturation RNase YbeY [Candidatus Eremiobacteraeota bacterium]MBC5828064.1 rRNA maturation RNase YbeY [Candidatus Eremiobacteraeota bacterium]
MRRAALATLARVAPHVRGDLTIVLAGDGFIRKLNRRYRRQDRATDVLSFEIGAGCAAGEPFGDVVISVETARRQAKQYDADVRTEMLRLLVHGTLHLCGYDHKGRTEAARMGALTSRLLQTLQSHV